jgi:CRISPR-associated protein Cmr3
VEIGKQRACRIVLLTPAYFNAGYKPTPASLVFDLHPELVAAAVPHAQVVSGWDMLRDNGTGTVGAPKPTRRLAPAGAVYFVRFDDKDDPQAIEEWARALWMRCISDDEQSRNDGFGLVALGVWNKETKQIGAK